MSLHGILRIKIVRRKNYSIVSQIFFLMYLGGPVPRDIYQRIKKLEDKILELEGISPEYFQSVVSISVF